MDKDTQALRAEPGLAPATGIAWARMSDKLDTTGWIELLVETTDSRRVSNDVRMYAAGLVEGLLTAVRMSQFYSNFYQIMLKDKHSTDTLANIRNMFADELRYVEEKAELRTGPSSEEPEDPYGKHVRYLLMQLWGIKDGYNHVAAEKGVRKIDMLDMLFINSHGELSELMEAFTPEAAAARVAFQGGLRRRQPATAAALLQRARTRRLGNRTAVAGHAVPAAASAQLADRDWERRLARRGHCSALVRVAPGSRDLFVGHTTWNDYSKMTRLFKYYDFKLPGSSSATSLMGFSSYPGCVSSTDDFYMLDSGLTVIDTTLEVLNPRLYDRVADFPANPHVPNFMHVMAVNRMAKTGCHWTTLFAAQNSGTNNAQWLVVDYNRFSPRAPIRDNTLRVLEQVPGFIRHSDMSIELRTKGYWASYNRPFFPDVRRMSGHESAERAHGALYSFENGPRATIFHRLGPAITSLFNMRSVMNRNAFPNEGVQPAEPGHAVSARLDLDRAGPIPNGGIDAKVTSRCLFRRLQCQAVSGPSHDSQPVFRWRDPSGAEPFPGWPHLGLPDVWDFGWVQMTPSSTLPQVLDPKAC